jgi:hypothetical protein
MVTLASFGTRSKFRVLRSSITYAAIALFCEPEPTITIVEEDLARWCKSRVTDVDFWNKYRTVRMWQGRQTMWTKARASLVCLDGEIRLMIKGDIRGTGKY